MTTASTTRAATAATRGREGATRAALAAFAVAALAAGAALAALVALPALAGGPGGAAGAVPAATVSMARMSPIERFAAMVVPVSSAATRALAPARLPGPSSAQAPAGGGAPAPADLVVLDAKVITVDPRAPVAQAAAIRGGRFVAVGSTADVRAFVGPGTRVIDARGRAVVPGLIDSHVHALMVADAEADQPFANLSSIAEIQAWVRTQAARASPGTWIWSPRLFPTRVREQRFPTRAELDAAAPDHPVAVDGAYAWVLNSAALRAAGITAATPDPPGGAIVKDATGAPTGLLRNVGNLLGRFRPETRKTPPLDMLARVHERYVRLGITSVIERGATLDGYRAYEALKGEGRLRVRAAVTIRIPKPEDAEATRAFVRGLPFQPRAGDEWLAVGPLKIVADGGILAGTSFMRRPYGPASRALYGVNDADYRGFLTLTREQIASAIAIGHEHGWQMVAHVTGDAGVDAVLDAFEAAQQKSAGASGGAGVASGAGAGGGAGAVGGAGGRAGSGRGDGGGRSDSRGDGGDRRHTLIHAYFADAQTAARAARLGVAVDTQPAWYYKDADALAPALGRDRLAHFIGLRTWLDAGVHTTINTDHMFGLDGDTAMNPFNPFLTIATAVTRKTEGGQVIGADEAVTRDHALRMMTIEAARLTFEEDRKGSIAVGKLGDLVILSDDPLTCPPDRLRAITADLTVIGGRIVYERATAPAPAPAGAAR